VTKETVQHIPKPIVCRQGMLAISDAYHDLPDWQGTQSSVRKLSESEKMLNPGVSLLIPGLMYSHQRLTPT